jgi:hypothetical protein
MAWEPVAQEAWEPVVQGAWEPVHDLTVFWVGEALRYAQLDPLVASVLQPDSEEALAYSVEQEVHPV